MIPFAVLNSLVSDVKKWSLRVNSVMIIVVLSTHAELASATTRGRSYWETGQFCSLHNFGVTYKQYESVRVCTCRSKAYSRCVGPKWSKIFGPQINAFYNTSFIFDKHVYNSISSFFPDLKLRVASQMRFFSFFFFFLFVLNSRFLLSLSYNLAGYHSNLTPGSLCHLILWYLIKYIAPHFETDSSV